MWLGLFAIGTDLCSLDTDICMVSHATIEPFQSSSVGSVYFICIDILVVNMFFSLPRRYIYNFFDPCVIFSLNM
jgi:hypothetical protein